MAFFTPCYRKTETRLLRVLLFCLLCCVNSLAHADYFSIQQAKSYLKDRVYHLDADLQLDFSEDALEALQSGVPLIILMDIEVEKVRHWWWNDTVAELEQGYLLLYHALSEKFIIHNLNSGAQDNFTTLHASLSELGHIRQLPIIDATLLDSDTEYKIRMRVYLDIESLPAPMRPIAYISSQWQLESDWYSWSLAP